MPVKEGWEHFNHSFHQLFQKEVPQEKQQARSNVWQSLKSMDIRQMGLYAWENGFDILRAGYIKAHNGLICKMW